MKKFKGFCLVVASALSFFGCGNGSTSSTNNNGMTITGIITGNGYVSNNIIDKILNNIITPLVFFKTQLGMERIPCQIVILLLYLQEVLI